MAWSHTQDDFNHHIHKPGGTATIALGKTTARVIDKGDDRLGRWSWLTLALMGSRKLSIITFYRVCKMSVASAGPTTYYMQLYRQHLKDGHSPNIDPRTQAVLDFADFIRTLQDHFIIVAMDANQSQSTPQDDDSCVFTALDDAGLVSAYSTVSHDATDLPTTYTRGQHCIDYIYISRALVPALTSITIHPFGTGFNSDHKPITLQIQLGRITHDYTRLAYRTITTVRVQQAEAFKSYLADQFERHKIHDRLEALSQLMSTDHGCTPDLQAQWNAIDTEKTAYITAATKRFASRHRDIPWSLPLSRSRLSVRYWAERLKALTHGYTIHPKWIKIQIDLGIDPIEGATEDHLRAAHKLAIKTYKAHIRDAASLRDQFLEDLAQEYADGDEKLKAKRLRTLKRREREKQMYSYITHLFQGPRAPLSALLVPDQETYKLTSDPTEMNSVLRRTNKTQLQASYGSPFVSGPLSIIGNDGFTEEAESILRGESQHGLVLPVTLNTVIRHLATVCPTLDLSFDSTKVNNKRFQGAMQITPEKTSSSPSGIHYGIYKVAIKDEAILSTLAQIASVPFRHGFVLDRWTQVTQVMIQKRPEPYYDKLRIIELFEGDYVAIIKAIMRQLMHHLYDNKVLGDGTFATEQNGSTHLAILSRVWAYDIARISRSAIATLDNDSVGCYDRMAPPLLSLLLRRVGLPTNVTKTFITQLLTRRQRVQTAYGLSEPIDVEPGEYMGGIGQGNPGGPTCYHLQLLPLLLTMRDLTHGYTISDAVGSINYTQHVASYVDDCNSLINLMPHEVTRNTSTQLTLLQTRAQHTLSTWVDLIRITGGDISILKSFWTLCTGWREYRGKLSPTGPALPCDLVIDGTPYPMKDPTVCERYLGVRVGISGHMQTEYAHRLEQSRHFASIVYKLSTRSEAALAYRSYYLPKLSYCLPVTTFTTNQLKHVESPSINALLSKLGYNRKFPRCIVFGPIEWGGLNLKPLAFIQGYQQTKVMLRVINTHTKITNLLKILIRGTYLEAGTNSIFITTRAPTRRILSYLTPTWVTCMLEFLATHSIDCNIDDGNMAPPLQRTSDKYLMDLFLAREPNYTMKQLRSLNRVRLHLQVYSLACISHRSNHRIDRRIMAQRTSWAARRSTLIWPKVTLKGHDWKTWTLAMKEICPTNNLGTWICTHQLWPLWQHPPPTLQTYWTETPGWQATISVQNQTIDPSLLHDTLYRTVQGPALQQYIRVRTGWTPYQFDQINWSALRGALSTYPLHSRNTALKAIYGWLHTASWQERIYNTSSKCPFCPAIENNTHIWVCPARTDTRRQVMDTFKTKCLDIGLPPTITVIFHNRLRIFLDISNGEVALPEQPRDQDIVQAYQQQEELGWDNFIRGRHSVIWQETFDRLLVNMEQRRGRPRTGKSMATKLVKSCLQLLVAIWCDHNQAIYSPDESGITMQSENVNARVREFYDNQHIYPQFIRDTMFNLPMEDRLKQRPFQLVKWMETINVKHQTSLREGSLYQYYHPTRPPEVTNDANDI